MQQSYQFEICANSVESALAAQQGGAHRVELCAGIPEGGTTPSYGEIVTARELLDIRLHVIIRPRGGDFLYSPTELKTMVRDVEMARKAGADGVVFGCLTAEGEVDMEAMRPLMKAAEGMSVTFHRAFDVCRDPFRALEQIIELGCDRILTSGQKGTAEQGMALLTDLESKAAGRIILLAGCGVNENNIAKLAAATGIHEFHFSARRPVDSGMIFHNNEVSMGGTVHIDEYKRDVTSVQRVQDTIGQLLKS